MAKSKKFYIDWEPGKAEFFVVLGSIAVVGFALSFAIIAYTPVRNLIPGYPTEAVKRQQVQNALTIDSLERSIYRWELYSENLRRVVTGMEPIEIDSLMRKFNTRQPELVETGGQESTDSTLRSYVSEREAAEMTDHNITDAEIEGLHFFKPLTGTVSNSFDALEHPYIDITAPDGSPVKSVLDGSVVYTSWSESEGWCMVIQHSSGILSIYKHNQKLLKNAGDQVSAGTSVALLGNFISVENQAPHLHFELWQNGTPVDPTGFIRF